MSPRMSAKNKTEEIKVRVEPLTKHVLLQIAKQEQLDLSDIARRAFSDFVNKRQTTQKHELANAA